MGHGVVGCWGHMGLMVVELCPIVVCVVLTDDQKKHRRNLALRFGLLLVVVLVVLVVLVVRGGRSLKKNVLSPVWPVSHLSSAMVASTG